jgi:hypothetical protein
MFASNYCVLLSLNDNHKTNVNPQMGNPEKLATYVTQDEEKQYKKHNAICVGHHITQANINNVNKTRALPQIIMIIPISFISWLVGRI